VPTRQAVDPSYSLAEALDQVCLVSFESHANQTGHPAPDPLLLGMKAAVVWSHMTNFTMIANGERKGDYFFAEDISDDDVEEITTDDDDSNFMDDDSHDDGNVSVRELPML